MNEHFVQTICIFSADYVQTLCTLCADYVKLVTWVVLIRPSHCCIQAAACLPQRVESQRTLFGARRTTSATAGFGAGGARDPRNPKTTGRSGGPRSRPKVQPAPPDVWKVSRHDRGAGGPLLSHPVLVGPSDTCSNYEFWRAFLRLASRR